MFGQVEGFQANNGSMIMLAKVSFQWKKPDLLLKKS